MQKITPTNLVETQKVAMFSDYFRPKIDGVSISLELLFNELNRTGYLCELFTIRWPGEYTDPAGVFRFQSVESLVNRDIRLSFPFNPKHLRHLVRTEYALFHSHTPGATGLLAEGIAELKRLPHFHTFHAYLRDYRHHLKMLGYAPSAEAMDVFSKWWANRADFLIVPTQKIYDWLSAIGVEVEMRVIPSGLDLSMFSPAKRGRESFFVDRGLVDAGDFVMLYIGRLAKEKAVNKLIEYFNQAVQMEKNVAGGLQPLKLVIVGDGPARDKLETLADSLGLGNQVVFTGFIDRDKLGQVYRSADAFGFLSTSETQGLVVVEAMAAGLPLLLADDPAYSEMLEEGANGFTVQKETDFVEALKQLRGNEQLRQAYGQKSQEMANRFDIQHTTKEILDYYQYGCDLWQQKEHRRIYDTVSLAPKKVIEKMHHLKTEIDKFIQGTEPK